LGYVKNKLPFAVVLENVSGLMETTPDNDLSDAAFICAELRTLGYGVLQYTVEAMNYGSFPRRLRLYWLAVLGIDEAGIHKMRTMLDSIRIGQISSWNDYELDNADHHNECSTSTVDTDMKYKQDHMRLFDDFKVVWPPAKGCFHGALDHLQQRPYEVVVFADRAHPYRPALDDRNAGKTIYEFMDFSQSLTRLCGQDGETNPWHQVFPTLTGTGTYAVRWGVLKKAPVPTWMMSDMALDLDDVDAKYNVFVRQVSGLEAMQMIGVPVTEYRSEHPSHRLASCMAGNAFSGFAVGPCLLAVMSVMKTGKAGTRPSSAVVEEDDSPASLEY
jgi:hypothetical protein